jgi:hypothetical protein
VLAVLPVESMSATNVHLFRKLTIYLNQIRTDMHPWDLKTSSVNKIALKSLTSLPLSNEHLAINRDVLECTKAVAQYITEHSDLAKRVSVKTKILSNLAHSATGYNAIQKVYRTQFDESRSHVRLRDFSMSYQPLYKISEIKPHFTQLLKKNTDAMYQPVFAKAVVHGPLSNLYSFQSSLATQTFDFPFRLAIKSDPARYL